MESEVATGHPDDKSVDNEEFVRSVADTVAMLQRLVDASRGIGARHGHLPSGTSRAMGDLEYERKADLGTWTEPLREAHALAGIFLFAGMDHVEAYAHLFAAPPVPVYSHLVVARAALEALGWCRWLADPRVSPETRARRGRVIRLADAEQLRGLPDADSKAKGKQIVQAIREGAPARYTVICNEKQISVGGERFPGTKTAVAAVLPSGAIPERLGPTLWSLLSGVAHAFRYALVMSMEAASPKSPARSALVGPVLGGFTTTSRTTHLIGCAVARAAIAGCGARFELFGWDDDPEWRDAVVAADTHIASVLRSASS